MHTVCLLVLIPFLELRVGVSRKMRMPEGIDGSPVAGVPCRDENSRPFTCRSKNVLHSLRAPPPNLNAEQLNGVETGKFVLDVDNRVDFGTIASDQC